MKFFLALTFCSLISCAGLQPISPSSLVGEWRYADKTKGCHYVFNGNGTFSGEVDDRGRTIMKFTGRWSIEGDTLLYTYINDALGRIPAGATDRDTILSVHGEFFVIEAADGSKRKYVRVPSERKPPNLRVTLSGGDGHFAHYLLARTASFLELSR
jgi:hypothetical protein